MPDDVETVVTRFINECVQPSPSDRLLILFDTASRDVGAAIASGSAGLTYTVPLFVPKHCLEFAANRGTLPPSIADAIDSSTITITCIADIDGYARFRGAAVRHARDNKHKVVHLPGVSLEEFLDAVNNTNFARVEETSNKYKALLSRARHVSIVTQSAASESLTLEFDISDRNVLACGGRASASEIMNLPTGEVYVAPLENSAHGAISLIGSTDHMVFVERDGVTLVFRDGRLQPAESVFGNTNRARRLRDYFMGLSDTDRTLCEFGIGTNNAFSKLSGQEVRDEKMAGTIHIALGNNAAFGGRNTESVIHRDIVISNPVLHLDGSRLALPS